MHNFVFFAQWRSQEFSCEPNFGGWGVPPVPPGCATVGYARHACRRVCVAVGYNCNSPTALLQTDRVDQRKTCVLHRGCDHQMPQELARRACHAFMILSMKYTPPTILRRYCGFLPTALARTVINSVMSVRPFVSTLTVELPGP